MPMDRKENMIGLMGLVIAGIIIGFSIGWAVRDRVALEWYEGTVIPGMAEEHNADVTALTLDFETRIAEAEDAWGLAMGSSIRSAYTSGFLEGFEYNGTDVDLVIAEATWPQLNDSSRYEP